MPGLSLVIAPHIDHQALTAACADLETDGVSSAVLLYESGHCAVVFSGHDGYPHTYFEDETSVIVLEGIVYNRSAGDVDRSLRAIAAALDNGGDTTDLVRDFVGGSDGDFLCAVYNKRHESLVAFNDHLGRLHSFYHAGRATFALSREVKFPLRFADEITIDRFGLGQYLMFEYTLGDYTLFRQVRRLAPSQSIGVNLSGKPSGNGIVIERKATVALRFDEPLERPSKKQCIDRLAGLYMESVGNRYETCRKLGFSCIADVSGGFDTRTVMVGLEKHGADVGYYTHELVSGDESRLARELGSLYGKTIQSVSAAHEVDYDEMDRLTFATDCTVNGWTALTSWQDSGVKRAMLHGKSASFMGFAGEFIRHPFHPAFGHGTLRSMLAANLLKSPLNASWASYLAGIPHDDFLEMTGAYFDTYPEQTIAGKLKRFYQEYYINLVAAGEDRTRRFFWTVQPLWGKDLYAFEMNRVPLDYAHFAFYADFMRALDPKALKIPIYGSNVRLESGLSLGLADAAANMKYHLRNLVLGNRLTRDVYFRRRGRDRNSEVFRAAAKVACETAAGLGVLQECIPVERIERFIGNGYAARNMYRLLGVLHYFRQIEQRFGEKITTENY